MKYLFFAPVLAVGFFFAPTFAAASSPDLYANTIEGDQMAFLSPDASLGAPDHVFADNFAWNGLLKLDMGQGEEGLGPLTLYYEIFDTRTQIIVSLLDAEGNTLFSDGGFVPLRNTWTFDYQGEAPYRFVLITNTSTRGFHLDAVEATKIVEGNQEEAASEVQESPEPVENIVQNPLRGSIIKLVDDGNDATDADKVTYLLDADNNRHVIPDEIVFQSWNLDKNDTTYVGEGTLAGTPLGANVFVRPGTFLLKIKANPNIYAIAPHGVLRRIEDERIAQALYGSAWALRIVDVPEVLFAQYKQGAPIIEAVYPNGSFVKDTDGNTWYVDALLERWSIGPKTLKALELNDAFLTTGMTLVDFYATHPFAGRLTYSDNLRWPF